MKHTLFFLCTIYAASMYGQVNRPVIKGVNKANVTCNGFANGTITIIASNGRPPYRYSDNGGVTFQSQAAFTSLTAGEYTVIIRDTLNQFSDSQKVEITEPSKLILGCSGVMQCDANSGSVSVNASGGTPPYTYLWNTGPTPENSAQTGLPAGTYIARVTDSTQCSDTCSVILKALGSSLPKYKVGDSISCGYIFYVDPNSDSSHPCSTHYLVCAYADQSNSVTWYNTRFTYTITNATTNILFDRTNALKIDSFSLAANACSKYTTDSCSGWYLPSKIELYSIYVNLAAKGIGGFVREGYWSSVEGTKRHCAWIVDFFNGREIQNDKSNKYHVRAVTDIWISNSN